MRISLIAAIDRNRAIGKDGGIPWHLPADFAYFKRVTLGHPIAMGRKTHESIGTPLPGRENLVITKNEEYTKDGVTIVHSPEEAIIKVGEVPELFFIGGAEIYKQMLPVANRLYLTLIAHEFGGDTYFPDFDVNEWKTVEWVEGAVDEKNKYPHFFLILDRK